MRRHYFDRDHDEFAVLSAPTFQVGDVTGDLLAAKLAEPYADEFIDQLLRADKVKSYEAAVNSLTAAPASQSVQTPAGSVTFNVTANVSWTVASNAPWLSVSPTAGTGNGTVLASFEENTSTMARTGTITVTGPVGVPAVTVTVSQAGVVLPTCSIPTGLKSNNITQSSAVLQWNAVSGAQSYTLQYRNLPAGVWSIPITVPGVTQTVNGLQPGISYEWQVNTNCTIRPPEDIDVRHPKVRWQGSSPARHGSDGRKRRSLSPCPEARSRPALRCLNAARWNCAA
jgi:hypothetical protein